MGGGADGTGFRPIDRVPVVSASIAEQLLERIRSGAFGIGQRLPSEIELAKEFQVSRPSVREALAALQFAGHVGSRRGFGTVVLPTAVSTGGAQPRRRRRRLHTVGEALDLLETRLLLEPYALATAAVDPDEAALEAAGQLISGMRLAMAEPELHATTDIRVHRALLAVCRNVVLRDSTTDLLDMALDPVLLVARTHAWSSPDLVHDWADQHQAVWEALRDGDPDRARAGSLAHLASVVDNVAAAATGHPDLERRIASLTTRPGVAPRTGRTDHNHDHDRRVEHG